MNDVLLIGGMALVTFAIRYPVLVLVGKIKLPDPIFRALKYVPPAILTAIILPAVLLNDSNQLNLRLTNAPLVAGLLAAFVAWRTRNVLLTIILGMLALWIWRALVGA